MTEVKPKITLSFNELPEVVSKIFEHTKWKTFSINIDFSTMPNRQLGWALKVFNASREGTTKKCFAYYSTNRKK